MKIVILPGWIQRSLLRQKLSLNEVLDWNKSKPALSLDDMAEWFHVNDSFTLSNCRVGNTVLETLFSNFGAKEREEFYKVILNLSISEETINSVKNKFSKSTDIAGNPLSEQTYQFIRIENILYIVLSEGFMASMLDKDSLEDFVKKYIKECYAMASVSEVSALGMFKLYLKHIA